MSKKYSNWQLADKIDKIINANITSYPYEGDEINRGQMRADILDLIGDIAPEYAIEF